MIKLDKKGSYTLYETPRDTKILELDGKQTFAWVTAGAIGEILVTSQKHLQTDTLLSMGEYEIYQVENEPNLSDQPHLQLSVGKDVWQGFLLPMGLPDNVQKRHRIIPTKEVVKQP